MQKFSFVLLKSLLNLALLCGPFLRWTSRSVQGFYLLPQQSSARSIHKCTTSTSRFANNISPGSDLNRQMSLAKHTFLRIAAALSSLPPEVFTTPPMMEPQDSIFSSSNLHLQASTSLLQSAWDHLDGYQSREEEELLERVRIVDEANQEVLPSRRQLETSPLTYGEITELGARQLSHYFKRYSRNTSSMNFVDIGSGVGKLVVQAYMEWPSLQKATGIELLPSRSSSANETWSRIRQQAYKIRNMQENLSGHTTTVEFIEGDIFEYDDRKLANATHIYVASLCFPDTMMHELARKLTAAHRLQCVATLSKFPDWFEEHFGKPRVEYIEMSWTRPQGERVYIYYQPRRR